MHGTQWHPVGDIHRRWRPPTVVRSFSAHGGRAASRVGLKRSFGRPHDRDDNCGGSSVTGRDQRRDCDRQRSEGQKFAHHAMVGRALVVARRVVAIMIAVVIMMGGTVVTVAMAAMVVAVICGGRRADRVIVVVVPRCSQCIGEQVARQHQPSRDFSIADHIDALQRHSPA
jgi:hypothetical protein